MMASLDLPKSDSLSTLSKYSAETSINPLDESFAAVKALNIHSRGIRLIRLPIPSNELTIPVYDTTGRVCYVSRRHKVCSGDAVLFGVGTGYHESRTQLEQWEDDGRTLEGTPLIETKYFFGPGRDPIINILGQDKPTTGEKDVELPPSLDEKQSAPSLRSVATNSTLVAVPSTSSSKSSFKFTSAWSLKTCNFVTPGSKHKFTWEKERTVLPSGEKAKLLVLYWHPQHSDGQGESAPKVRVSQFVRSVSTRTPGTRPSTAGNGGRLEFGHLVQCTGDLTTLAPETLHDSEKKAYVPQEPVIDEALVVATCISMMKKEGDRRRALQVMMVGAIVGGGV